MSLNKIPWTHYQDIQVPDQLLRKQFDEYISNAQYAEAIQLLKNNDQQLSGKAYISDVITEIVNGILWLQNEFDENVHIYLSETAQMYKNLIASVTQRGEWNSSVQYEIYNFVTYKDEIYMAFYYYTPIPIGTLPTNSKYWLKLGLRGHSGSPGIDINIRYGWMDNRQYKRRDVVAYGDNLYIALKDNASIVPGTDETTWLTFILVQKGGIAIGANPPEKAGQNTVWFKTPVDPLVVTEPVDGEFMHYVTETDEWEPMYPVTLFTLIEGAEVYTGKANFKKVSINTNDWERDGTAYNFTFIDNDILKAKFVEVVYGNHLNNEQFNLFSSLTIQVSGSKAVLKTQRRPIVELPLVFIIQ